VTDRPTGEPEPAREGQGGRGLLGRSAWAFAAALCVETLLLLAARWPVAKGFGGFAFGDLGGNLTVTALARRGLRPMVDFGWSYGTLPVLLGDLWFRGFGLTPAGYMAFVVACNLAIAGAVARFAAAVGAKGSTTAWLAATLPFTLCVPIAQVSHGLEAVWLAWALALHASGRREWALAALTACVLTRPSMAYVYGLWLVAASARGLVARRAGFGEWLKAYGPAAVVGVAAGAILTAVYGPTSVARTLLPTTGARVYRELDYGFFFGTGRFFWNPPAKSIGYYFGTVVATWIAATFLLAAAAAGALVRWLRSNAEDSSRPRDEAIVAAAAIHFVFVFFAFGWAATWAYYFFALALGVAAASSATPWARRAAWGLTVMAIVGWTHSAREDVRVWRAAAPAPEAAGLWSTDDERADWRGVVELVRGKRASVLVFQVGGLETIFPELGFSTPGSWVYSKGIVMPHELTWKARQVAESDAVVMEDVMLPHEDFLAKYPEFAAALAGFSPTRVGRTFTVYLRDRGRDHVGTRP
jgi:hypothetical protein